MGNPLVVRRLGVRRVAAGGLAVMALGLALAAWAVPGPRSLTGVVAALVVMGVGNGAAAVCGIELLMASVPAARAGSAAGVNETLVEAGGAVGVAVLGSTLAAGSGFGTPVLVAAGACLAAAAGVWWLLRPTPRATLAAV